MEYLELEAVGLLSIKHLGSMIPNRNGRFSYYAYRNLSIVLDE